jgi:hypothetical protein
MLARPGSAGTARHDRARSGMARLGPAGPGAIKAGSVRPDRLAVACLSLLSLGVFGFGMTWQAWRGLTQQASGMVRRSSAGRVAMCTGKAGEARQDVT